jgi:hypothetical protein
MYAATPCEGRVDFDDKPTTAIVRHPSRIFAIASELLMSKVNARLRLCRLMCGKALPFREELSLEEAMPPGSIAGGAASPKSHDSLTERQSLSAHQGAKPKTKARLNAPKR